MSFIGFKSWISKHLPSREQVVAVYGVIVFLVYGWTIYWYLWKLPSWLYFMTLDELLVTYSYAQVVNIMESLLVLLVPILVGFVLPHRWFNEKFVARGVTLILLLLVALMNYLNIITALQGFPPGLPWMILATLAVMIVVVFLAGYIPIFRKVMDEIGNRATIFLYIFLPISVISILVVFIRNVMRL